MTPTFLRAAQAKVEVLDMRAATQGLPPFNRYVHISCRVVMDSVARWTEEPAFAESVCFLHPRSLLQRWARLQSVGASHVIALHLATGNAEASKLQLQHYAPALFVCHKAAATGDLSKPHLLSSSFTGYNH